VVGFAIALPTRRSTAIKSAIPAQKFGYSTIPSFSWKILRQLKFKSLASSGLKVRAGIAAIKLIKYMILINRLYHTVPIAVRVSHNQYNDNSLKMLKYLFRHSFCFEQIIELN
jgi:isocitrate lyase